MHYATIYYAVCMFIFCIDLPCAAPGVDGFWHRGLICEVTENTVQVFYVDLGYTLILSYDAIKPLPKKYMSCKTQVIDDSYQFHIYTYIYIIDIYIYFYNSTKIIFLK